MRKSIEERLNPWKSRGFNSVLPPGSLSFVEEAPVAEDVDDDVLDDEYEGVPEFEE